MSERKYIFPDKSGYIPILLENIPGYVMKDNFELDYIKEIQTIGYISYFQDKVLLCEIPSNEENKDFEVNIVLFTSFLRDGPGSDLSMELRDDIQTVYPKIVSYF